MYVPYCLDARSPCDSRHDRKLFRYGNLVAEGLLTMSTLQVPSSLTPARRRVILGSASLRESELRVHPRSVVRPTRVTFGGTAAIVTSMALITGLAAANASRHSVIGALLIIAVVDNLTDSLGIHMYQESECLEKREAFIGTLANFATRLILCLSFVLIIAVLGVQAAAGWSVLWGMALLAVLSYFVARHRSLNTASEVAKHVAIALLVIFVSKGLGLWITNHFN